MSRGAIVMSNLVYTSALIYLASEAAGCLGDDDKVDKDCDKRVYGFPPAALMANIAVVSGVLSALFMPLCGAIVDYTSHRWTVGVFFTSLMIIIQIVQIYTVDKTWFPMLVLQALAGFFYQIEVMAISAYLPDMAREVGQKSMTKCKSAMEEIFSWFLSLSFSKPIHSCNASYNRFHAGPDVLQSNPTLPWSSSYPKSCSSSWSSALILLWDSLVAATMMSGRLGYRKDSTRYISSLLLACPGG
jgi:hypothetical protein